MRAAACVSWRMVGCPQSGASSPSLKGAATNCTVNTVLSSQCACLSAKRPTAAVRGVRGCRLDKDNVTRSVCAISIHNLSDKQHRWEAALKGLHISAATFPSVSTFPPVCMRVHLGRRRESLNVWGCQSCTQTMNEMQSNAFARRGGRPSAKSPWSEHDPVGDHGAEPNMDGAIIRSGVVNRRRYDLDDAESERDLGSVRAF